MTRTSVSLFILSLQLFIQVPFLSFSSVPSSSTTLENAFHFPRDAGFFNRSCELRPPSPTAECCHPDLACHPFDDKPEFVLVMALFTVDLDFEGVGDREEEKETLMSQLETHGITQFRNLSRPHSSSESRSLSLSPLSNNNSGLSPSLHPIISLSRFQTLSAVISNAGRIDL